MSLETWKLEFYPTDASDCKEDDALEHSLRKWIGLRKENLEKHGLKCNDNSDAFINDEGSDIFFMISYETCSLCQFYFGYEKGDCQKCPLSIARNGEVCFRPDDESPYEDFVNCGNPEPMIELIQKAIDMKGGKT